uniref:SAM domain, SH3 domain and nuclear localisation signals 1b n=2 Tax=Anabas testudineus TaxID=64144 RepID=A0A3Q1GYH5_ANATE
MSCADKKDLSHQKKTQNRETSKGPCQNIKMTNRERELNSDRTDLTAQDSEAAAESMRTTEGLKRFQSLVQAGKEHWSGTGKLKNTPENNDHLADVLSNSNPVLTCIGLRRRTKTPSENGPSPRQQQATHHQQSEEEDGWSPCVATHLWSPFEFPQPWSPFYHTCHQARPELWVCGGTLSLPRATEWDRFESLIQELDNKQCTPSPPQMIRSITDLHLSQNMWSRFGRFDAFRQHPPLMKPRDNESCCLQKQERSGDSPRPGQQGRQTEAASRSDRKHGKASPELTAIINGNRKINEAPKREIGDGRPFTKGHRLLSNSLESLYSLHSGQSSSSGVTSGSDYSSNRGSLRLEDDLLYARHFCGRARVHTDHVPSPYDTESLKLKVGDVIDIISKPPMGIWTGMLNGKIGNFKFIYVDVLTEESIETHSHRMRHKSTVQEVLRRLSLEEYSSSLQLNGYQTVDDLITLKEHHLMELNVTDPEHKHRLLAAVDCLRQLHPDSQSENEVNQEAETPSESTKARMNNYPRDLSCHTPSDSPDKSALHMHHEHPPPAETMVS